MGCWFSKDVLVNSRVATSKEEDNEVTESSIDAAIALAEESGAPPLGTNSGSRRQRTSVTQIIYAPVEQRTEKVEEDPVKQLTARLKSHGRSLSQIIPPTPSDAVKAEEKTNPEIQ